MQDDDSFLSFEAYASSHEDHICNILQHTDLSDARAEVVAAQIHAETPLFGGTDGGLMEGQGTFGFVWADNSRSKIMAKGKGHVPGHTHGMSSTRAELCGIFAALFYVQLVTTYHYIVPTQSQNIVYSVLQ